MTTPSKFAVKAAKEIDEVLDRVGDIKYPDILEIIERAFTEKLAAGDAMARLVEGSEEYYDGDGRYIATVEQWRNSQ